MKTFVACLFSLMGCSSAESVTVESYDSEPANEDAGVDATESDGSVCVISGEKDPPICVDAGAKP